MKQRRKENKQPRGKQDENLRNVCVCVCMHVLHATCNSLHAHMFIFHTYIHIQTYIHEYTSHGVSGCDCVSQPFALDKKTTCSRIQYIPSAQYFFWVPMDCRL